MTLNAKQLEIQAKAEQTVLDVKKMKAAKAIKSIKTTVKKIVKKITKGRKR